jgi:5,10-methenyltetrahydrofolate synthetase
VSSTSSLRILKRQLREKWLHRIASVSFLELIGKSGNLSDHFFEFVRRHEGAIQGGYLVSFCPFGNEPQINVEIEGGGEPYRVAYVRVEDWASRKMSIRAARRDTPDLWEVLEPVDGVGIDQPRATVPAVKDDEVRMILVPAVAFTREGVRLGRGAGFYDRFLRSHPFALRVGVGFSEQIAPDLPEDSWDERVDIILTDREIIATNSYGDWTNHGKIIHRNKK